MAVVKKYSQRLTQAPGPSSPSHHPFRFRTRLELCAYTLMPRLTHNTQSLHSGLFLQAQSGAMSMSVGESNSVHFSQAVQPRLRPSCEKYSHTAYGDSTWFLVRWGVFMPGPNWEPHQETLSDFNLAVSHHPKTLVSYQLVLNCNHTSLSNQ